MSAVEQGLDNSLAGPRAPSGDFAVGVSFVLLGFLFFSANDAIARYLTTSMSPPAFTMFTAILAVPVIWSFFKLRGEAISLWPNRPWLVALRSVLGGLTALCAFTAFQVLPLAEAYVFIFTVPLFLTALSVIVFREKVGWRRWTAVAVGFLGVIIAFQPGVAQFSFGHLMALACALFGSSGFIVLRIVSATEKRPTMALWLLPGMILLPLPLVIATPGSLPDGQWSDLWLIASAVAFSAAQLCMITVARAVKPSQVAPFQYSQIIWGVVFGWVLFSEWPQNSVWFGLVLIVGAGAYTWHRERLLARRASVLQA